MSIHTSPYELRFEVHFELRLTTNQTRFLSEAFINFSIHK